MMTWTAQHDNGSFNDFESLFEELFQNQSDQPVDANANSDKPSFVAKKMNAKTAVVTKKPVGAQIDINI